MKLWCVGFNEFEHIAKRNGWCVEVPSNIAIISINNGKDAGTDDEYHVCENDYNVLNLNFDDIDPIALGLSDDTETYKYENKYAPGTFTTIEFFTTDMAKRAVKFIDDIIENNKLDGVDFYIHCSAGVSRSQAFVKFIKNVYYEYDWETNPNNPCVHPNGFVFQKLMRAYRSRE
jgi:hypothetical protein